MSKITIVVHGSHELDMEQLAKDTNITQTQGWSIYKKQRLCGHNNQTQLYLSLGARLFLCTDCGELLGDLGIPT